MTSTQPRRVAITTFWDGSPSYECALPLWCQSAARLSAVLPEAHAPEVVLIAPRRTVECLAAKRYVWDPETAAASRRYVQRMSRSRRPTRAGGANMESFLKDAVLLKWTVFTMLDFDLVLFSDLDIDVLPTNTRNHTLRYDWTRSIDAFMASAALYVSSPDHASPTNTGIWLAKPRRWVHRQALNVLANSTFSHVTGYDDVGQPLGLFNHRRSTTRLLHQLDAGAAADRGVGDNKGCCVYFCRQCNFQSHTESALNMTAYQRGNHWQFVCATLDQGMFWYVLHLLHGVGTWAQFHRVRWNVHHFWGGNKPWILTTPRANYLRRLELPAKPTTRCQFHLSNSIKQLKQLGHWDPGRGAAPKSHAVLPSPTVASFKPGCPYSRQAFSPMALSRAAPGAIAQGLSRTAESKAKGKWRGSRKL